MIYNPTDRLDFGKYMGVETGLVYLLAPGYIKWAIRDHPSFCLGEVDFLSSLDVIDLFGKGSWEAHQADVDVQMVKSDWAKLVGFEKLKFSGYKPYRLPDEILEINAEKQIGYGSRTVRRKIVPREERFAFIFYPGLLFSSKITDFTPTEWLTKEDDPQTIIGFTVDNTSGILSLLPHVADLKVSSFWWPDWNLEEDEIQQHIDESKPFIGSIDDGFLILRK